MPVVRILFITRKYPPIVGGMELLSYELYEALTALADVRLVKWSGSGRLKAVLIAVPWLTFGSFLALCRGGVDVIHVNDGLLAPTAWLLAKLFRKPFTVTIHGLDMTYTNPLFKVLVPWSVRRADQVFCVSHAGADEALKRGVPADRLLVVPPAVRDELHQRAEPAELFDHLDIPAGAPVLLSVGRLVERKGVAWFVEHVLPALAKEHPRIVYVIVGEGRERDAIQAAARRRGVEDNLRLTGQLEDSLHAAAYNGADVFVMPNIHVPGDVEGFGLVVLEASLCELPVVAAGIEGIKDAVADGHNGVLVPSRDAAAFRKAVDRFLAGRANARRFGAASRRYTLEHYQWPKIAARYVEAFKRLID